MLTAALDALVAGPVQTRELGPRAFLFHQGDRADYVFAVESGRIKLLRSLENGKDVVMLIARAGDTFTEPALFSDTYHCNAVADIKSRVRMYPKKDILAALAGSPQLGSRYAAALSRLVRRLRTLLELRNISSARERMLQYFLLEAAPTSREFTTDVPLKDIAAQLGLAHETFYRTLAALEKNGILTHRAGTIKLHEPQNRRTMI